MTQWPDGFFDAGLAAIVLFAAYEPWRALREAADAARHACRRRIAVATLIIGCPLLASGAYSLAGLLAALIGFFTIALSYLSLPDVGYSAPDEEGLPVAHKPHHLHLLGLILVAALAADIVTALLGSSPGADFPRYAAYGAFGAHYLVSGLAKISRRGRTWLDRRFFPFYIMLMSAYRSGDGAKPPSEYVVRVFRRPGVGIGALAAALMLELASPAVVAGVMPRVVIGLSLLTLHLSVLWLLGVDFRENMALCVLVALPVGHAAGANGEVACSLLSLAACSALSLILGERCFPFSRLPMFTRPYCATIVATVRRPDGSLFSTPKVLGLSTAALSRNVAEAAETDLAALVEDLRVRLRAGELDGPALLVRELITVTDQAEVIVSSLPAATLEPWGGKGQSPSV